MNKLTDIDIDEYIKNTKASQFLLVFHDGSEMRIWARGSKVRVRDNWNGITALSKDELKEDYRGAYIYCNSQNISGGNYQLGILEFPAFD